MTTGMRITAALLAGLANGALVFGLSQALDTQRVWPGTVFAFASGALTALIFSHPRRGGR